METREMTDEEFRAALINWVERVKGDPTMRDDPRFAAFLKGWDEAGEKINKEREKDAS